MKAISHIDKLLAEVEGAELATAFRTGYDPMYVDVVVAPFKALMPWFGRHGFKLVPTVYGMPSKFAWVHEEDRVMATIQEAFGGKVSTGFPDGWPQKITALVEAGFVDLDSPAVRRHVEQRKRRRKNPQQRYHGINTLSGWMRAVNGILLKEISLGTWQITKQPYEQWFLEGMRPSTAANIIIDGVSMGSIRRRYRRHRS